MRIGEVELEIIDLITFIGIIITFLTGVLNLFQNKKSLYINNITKYRMIWITTLRGHVANLKELSNITNLYIMARDGANKINYRRELEKNVSYIKMYLNFNGKLDNKLITKVEKLKSIINSYLSIYYCKNKLKDVNNNDEIVGEFIQIVDIINEKRLLKYFLKIAVDNRKIKEIKINEYIDLLVLRNMVKYIYKNNSDLIGVMIKESDSIINIWENQIERLNNEIDVIVQIYLKSEWIRCKVETRMWPFSRYNEEKVVSKLEKQYNIQKKQI